MTDTIVFPPLTGWRNDASIDGSLRLAGEAYGAPPAGAVIDGGLVLAGDALMSVALGLPMPLIPSTFDGGLVLGGEMIGSARHTATIDGGLVLGGEAFDGGTGAAVDAFIDGGLVLGGEMIGPPDFSAYGFLVERQYEMRGYGGLVWETIGDTLGVGDAAASRHTSVIASGLALTQRLRGRFDGRRRLKDALQFEDRLAGVFHELLRTALQLGDAHHLDAIAVQALVDRLLLGGEVDDVLQARQLIADAIAFATSLDPFLHEALLDGLTLSAGLDARIEAAERWVDTMLLEALAPATATFTAVMRDGVAIGSDAFASAEFREVMRDALGFVIRLSLDDGQYVAWVMNTETKALTRYTQFPFNSFMRVGGNVYGVSDVGLYRLGGDTDDGAPIAAQVRRGLNDLGTRVFKRTPSFYVGYSSTGELRIKAVVVGEDGEREAHVYALKARDAANARVARAKLGRGLRSVYWDFVVENADGADFDVDVFELEAVLMKRRTRGDSAGRPE